MNVAADLGSSPPQPLDHGQNEMDVSRLPAQPERVPTRTKIRLGGRRDLAWILGLTVLSFALRVWAPGPVTETYDERRWLTRTDQFIDAVKTGNFDRATPSGSGELATMPGVTVMLAGSGARVIVKAAGRAGLIDAVEGPSVLSATMLRASRAVVAFICAVALGLLVWIASRLLGRRAALIAGVLLATEPFMVGHSDLLHTDALVAMLSSLAVVSAMAALWSKPGTDPAGDSVGADGASGAASADPFAVSYPLVGVSAVATGLALLTKLNAIPLLLPAFVAIGVVEVLRRLRTVDRPSLAVLRPLVFPVGVWSALVVVVGLLLWPALWTSPMTQLNELWASGHIANNVDNGSSGSPYAERHFFVPINLMFRMSPWMLVGGIVATVYTCAAVVRRPLPAGWPARRVLVVLLVSPVPYLLLIERSDRVFDRYLLPFWPFVALVVGVALSAWLSARDFRPVALRAASLGLLTLLVAAPLAQAPYGSAFSNPVFGRNYTEGMIALGWGEGVERLGQTIVDREGDQCHETRVAIRYPMRIAVPCGILIGPDSNRQIPTVDYVIIEARHRQRHSLPSFEAAIEGAELVENVTIDGVPYAQLWKVSSERSPSGVLSGGTHAPIDAPADAGPS